MRIPAIAMVVVLAVITASPGAVVSFVGPQWVIPGMPVSFDVVVTASPSLGSGANAGKFNGADLVLGWNEPGDLLFQYAPEWYSNMFPTGPSYDNGFFANDVYVGGVNISGGFFDSLKVGTVTLDTISMPFGEYTLAVDSSISALSNGASSEPISGSMYLIVIPEPATMALLALGVLAARRRPGLGRTVSE